MRFAKAGHVPRKRNNSPSSDDAKILIRSNVLSEIGAGKAQVFDAYAGDGKMYRAVWHQAARYVGCDLEYYPDERMAYVADNLRVMRAIDLGCFNVFDLDAYGSPWAQAYILGRRRPLSKGERIGVIYTEGLGMKMAMGGMSTGLAALIGVRPRMPGMATAHDDLINRAVKRVADLMGGVVVRRWQAQGKTGSAMRYVGVVIQQQDRGGADGRPLPPARPQPGHAA